MMILNQNSLSDKAERREISFVIFIFIAIAVGVLAVGGVKWLLLTALAISALLGITILVENWYERLSQFGK